MNTKSITAMALSSVILASAQPSEAKLRITIKKKDLAAIGVGVAAAAVTAAVGGDAGDVMLAGLLGGIGTKVMLDALDHDERRNLYDCQNNALHGRMNNPYTWQGRPGYQGEVVVLREGYHSRSRQMCREYKSTIVTPYKTETHTSIACVSNNGVWQDTEINEVTFGSSVIVEAPVVVVPAPIIVQEQPVYHGTRIIDTQEMANFVQTLRNESFDDKRNDIVSEYIAMWSQAHARMTSSQCDDILRSFEWDSHRITALQLLLPMVMFDRTEVEEIISSFEYDSNKNQARQMVVSRLLQAPGYEHERRYR